MDLYSPIITITQYKSESFPIL